MDGDKGLDRDCSDEDGKEGKENFVYVCHMYLSNIFLM